MAITKTEAQNLLTSADKQALDLAEAFIDQKIQECFDGKRLIIEVADLEKAVGSAANARLLHNIVKLYQQHEWSVSVESDQREGNTWLEFC